VKVKVFAVLPYYPIQATLIPKGVAELKYERAGDKGDKETGRWRMGGLQKGKIISKFSNGFLSY
jgi:hypothetical protein